MISILGLIYLFSIHLVAKREKLPLVHDYPIYMSEKRKKNVKNESYFFEMFFQWYVHTIGPAIPWPPIAP